MSIFNNTTNQEQQQKQQDLQKERQQQESSVGSTKNEKPTDVFEEFGKSVAQKASEAKKIAESKASQAKETVESKASETKDAVGGKINDGRSWIGDKLDGLQHTIEPPKPEPEEPQSIGERLGAVQTKLANTTVNLKDNVVQKCKDGKEMTAEKTDESRSWIANQLGGLSKTIEPEEKKEEEPPTFSQAMADTKEIASDKLQEIKSNAAKKTEETKEVAHDKIDDARSWVADKVGGLKGVVEPTAQEDSKSSDSK